MKKLIVIAIAAALLMTSTVALAEKNEKAGANEAAVKSTTTTTTEIKTDADADTDTEIADEDKDEDKDEEISETSDEDKTDDQEVKEDDKTDEVDKDTTKEEKDEEVKTDDQTDKDKTDTTEETVKENNGKSKIDKALLKQKKEEFKAAKAETAEYIKEIKALFKDSDPEAKKEILAEIAAAKKALKDYSIGTFIKGIEVDYKKYDDVKPVIENDRTLVPIRALSEAYGATVAWDEATQTITISKDDIVITMQIDSLTAKVNDQEVVLEVAPKVVKNRTLVPIRFVSESLNLGVEWDQDSQTIVVE